MRIFVDLFHNTVEIYMDDFTPYGCGFQEDISNLCKILKQCIEMNISLSPEKCEFLMNAGTILGHSISKEGIQIDPNKISTIKLVLAPKRQRVVRSFLGLAGYYRRFIKDFSKLVAPMFGLMDKDSEFCSIDRCQEAFEELKEKFTTTPIHRGPNWSFPFHIHTYALDKDVEETL